MAQGWIKAGSRTDALLGLFILPVFCVGTIVFGIALSFWGLAFWPFAAPLGGCLTMLLYLCCIAPFYKDGNSGCLGVFLVCLAVPVLFVIGTVLQGCLAYWSYYVWFPEMPAFLAMFVMYTSPFGGLFFAALVIILFVKSKDETSASRIIPALRDHILRGFALKDFDDPSILNKCPYAFPQDQAFGFGRVWLPVEMLIQNTLLMGSPGSGKSLSMQRIMQAVLPAIGTAEAPDQRAVLNDTKKNYSSLLAGMGVTAETLITNPYDRDASRWRVAEDFSDISSANQFALMVIPRNPQDKSPYFADAARALLSGVVKCLIERMPGEWTLRHVKVCCTKSRMIRLFEQSSDPEVTGLIEEYFGRRDEAGSVLSTLATHLHGLGVIAALSEKAESTFSLAEFLQSESILLLGDNHENRSGIAAFNRLVIQRLAHFVLDQPDSRTRRTYFFLDELRLLGKMDALNDLLIFGRSKGAACILAFQSFRGVQSVWGQELAAELVNSCNLRGFFRLNDNDDAEFASRSLDEVTENRVRPQTGSNQGSSYSYKGGWSTSNNSNTTWGYTQDTHRLVPPAVFKNIPLPSKEAGIGITGYYMTPVTGAFKSTLASQMLSQELARPAPDIADFIPRAKDDERLNDLTDEELRRLGLMDDDDAPPTGPAGDKPAPSGGNGERDFYDTLSDVEQQRLKGIERKFDRGGVAALSEAEKDWMAGIRQQLDQNRKEKTAA